MNNIKLFMLLIMAATSSVALADGGTWNFSESNGTLTINASGDLTTAYKTTSNKVFTPYAVGYVYTDQWGYSPVASGGVYDESSTYYYATRTFGEVKVQDNADWSVCRGVNKYQLWKDNCTNVYKASLTDEYTWNIAEGTNLYAFPAPTDVWNFEGNVYNVTYKPYDWTSDKGSNRVYEAYYNNNNTTEDATDDHWTFGNIYWGLPDNGKIYDSGHTYSHNDVVYVYIDSNSNWWPNYGDRTTNGTCEFVPSSWVISDVITIGAQVNNGSEYPGDGDTFDYNNTYYKYVTSTSPLTSNTTYQLSSLAEGMSLISDMSAYHGYTTVNVNKQTNGEIFKKNTATFQYDGRSSLCYATSSNGDLSGAVALSELTLIRTDEGEGGLRGYYTSQPKLVIGNAVSEGDTYTDNGTFYYNSTYVGYVKLSAAYDSGNNYYPGDEGVTLITSSDLTSTYLQNVTKYTAGDNLYRTTSEETEEVKLTAGVEYTLNEGDHLWKSTAVEYSTITNNETFFQTDHTSYIDIEKIYFKEALRQQILSGSYTKVEFVNTGSGELTIDPEIVRNIIAPDANPNGEYRSYQIQASLTELDLGAATTASFDNMFNITHGDGSKAISTNLATLTLPKTTVSNGVMTVPTGVVSLYKNGDKLRTVKVPEGYTKIGNNAFEGNSITTVNLPNSLTEIGDEAFMNCGSLKYINSSSTESQSIKFPSANLTTIGKSAFAGCTSLTSTESDPFILPESLTTIKASAFVSLKGLKFLKLNDNLEYVGNTAFGLDNASLYDQTTITFPSTIKYLGPGSFVGRMYQDIYFTGTTAPVCPVGKPAFNWGNVTAFSANIQMGNNGFASESDQITGSTADSTKKGYANRENYINNGYYFTILHFPEGLSNDQAKTYRDITRRYVTRTGNAQADDGNFYYGGSIAGYTDPATGKTFGEAFQEGTTSAGKSKLVYYMSSDGLLTESACADNLQPGYVDTYMGKQQIWPSQMQWTRNFVTVANGVEWNGITKYRPEVTEDMFDMMKADGLFVKANSLDYSTKRVADANNSNEYGHDFSLADITWSQLKDNAGMLDYLSLILYQGTRRFVLSYDGGYDIPFKVKLKGGRWWSICLPFNMTKAEVDEVFGGKNEGTHVCLMSGVDRKVSESGNTLVLKFKNDVYRHKTVRTVTEASDGKSFTYTYEKNFNESNDPPGANDIVIYARESYMIYPVREDSDTDPVEYNFGSPVFETGNPLPTIVYSNSNAPYTTQNGTDPAYRFIGNFTTSTGNDANGKAITIKIPQYSYAYGRTSSSASLDKSKFFILETAGATWSPFKSIVQNTADGGGAADWLNFFQQNTARVNQVSLFGDDEEVTGIDNVIIEVSSDNDEDLRVFNLNGSMMGNSLQGLPAGTYIQGGKAYRVK